MRNPHPRLRIDADADDAVPPAASRSAPARLRLSQGQGSLRLYRRQGELPGGRLLPHAGQGDGGRAHPPASARHEELQARPRQAVGGVQRRLVRELGDGALHPGRDRGGGQEHEAADRPRPRRHRRGGRRDRRHAGLPAQSDGGDPRPRRPSAALRLGQAAVAAEAQDVKDRARAADGYPAQAPQHAAGRRAAAADVPQAEGAVFRARPGTGRAQLDSGRQSADAPGDRRRRRQGLQDLSHLREGARVNALILAGSRGPADPMAQAAGVSHKALAPVGGVPMLLRVAEALRESGRFQRLYVCIEDASVIFKVPGLEAMHRNRLLETIAAADSPAASVAAALKRIDLAQPLLVTTGDHPLLTPAILERFLDLAPKDCDLAVALAPADVVSAAYPGAIRTFYKLGGKRYSGCNLFLARS